jgi:ribosomal protein S18 acetylase RimI-like enzyme
MIEVIEADLNLPANAVAVVQLLNEYALDPMGGGQALSPFVQDNLVQELQKRDRVYVILAQVDDVPAGLAIAIEGFSTFACQPLLNIHDVVVSQAYRGKGISQLLLAKVEEIAQARGCCKITLEVLEGNPIAQAAYRKMGFDNYQLDPIFGRAMFWQKRLD